MKTFRTILLSLVNIFALLCFPIIGKVEAQSSDLIAEEANLRAAFTVKQFKPSEPVLAVNLTSMIISAYMADNQGKIPTDPIFTVPCCPGKNSGKGDEFATPNTYKDGLLDFTTVISKELNGTSDQYPGEMPFCLRLGIKDSKGNLRGICIHEGSLRPYAVSHGCIRVAKGDAEKLFRFTPEHTKVFIIGNAAQGNKMKDTDDEPSDSEAKEKPKQKGDGAITPSPKTRFEPEDYIVRKNGKAYLKVQLADRTERDIEDFRHLVKNHLIRICYLDNTGRPSLDKTQIKFRFEDTYMKSGSGISVAEVEKLLGLRFELRPPKPIRR